MNAAEIKLDLFRKLDALKGKKLKEAYGILVNHLNGEKDVSDWDVLTKEQKNALHVGINQLNNNEGRKHNDVMSKLKKRLDV